MTENVVSKIVTKLPIPLTLDASLQEYPDNPEVTDMAAFMASAVLHI